MVRKLAGTSGAMPVTQLNPVVVEVGIGWAVAVARTALPVGVGGDLAVVGTGRCLTAAGIGMLVLPAAAAVGTGLRLAQVAVAVLESDSGIATKVVGLGLVETE